MKKVFRLLQAAVKWYVMLPDEDEELDFSVTHFKSRRE